MVAEEATAVAADSVVADFTVADLLVAVGFTVADSPVVGFVAADFAGTPFTTEWAFVTVAFAAPAFGAIGSIIAALEMDPSSLAILATRSSTIPTTTDIIRMGTTPTVIILILMATILTDTAMDMDTRGSAIVDFAALAFAAAAFTTGAAGATGDARPRRQYAHHRK